MRAIILCVVVVAVLIVNTQAIGLGGPRELASSEWGSFQAQLAHGLRRLKSEQAKDFTLTDIKTVTEQPVAGTIWKADLVFKEGDGSVEIVEQLSGKLKTFQLTVSGTEYTVGSDQ